MQDIEGDLSEVSELTNNSSSSFILMNRDSRVIATATKGGLQVDRITCFQFLVY